MLMFCDPTDCYGLYCLERGFWMGRSLHGDAQQKQSQGPDGPAHFQLRSDTWHIPGGKGIPELYYTFLQHHSGNLWQGCIKTWGCDPSTCHLPQESRHLGATGHCCAHSLRAQAETLNFQIHFSKIPFCMSAMWLWFWKMAPQNSKAGTLCSGTWQSLMNNFFFCLPAAITPHNGQNCTAGYLSSCLHSRRVLFLLTWWYFHLNCIAPSRWEVTWQI